MNVVADDGTVLDATFSIDEEPLSLVYESAGRTGVNARNRDYSRGLSLLLQRLRVVGGVIQDIHVDSVVTRRLPPEQRRVSLQRHRLPLALAAVGDLADLKGDISTAAREPGAREGARRGGSSRRLRFLFSAGTWAASDVKRVLAGSGAAPEAEVVHEVIEVAAGRAVGRTQGYLLSPAIKRAVEMHAMERAIAEYSTHWTVVDVHADHPYDLECRRETDLLHVEVKGTTSRGEAVIVTPNEVQHARSHHPRTELFVVSEIHVEETPGSPPRASGGTVAQYPGWGMDDGRLRPVGFEYRPGSSAEAAPEV